jgi:hypothetical protein
MKGSPLEKEIMLLRGKTDKLIKEAEKVRLEDLGEEEDWDAELETAMEVASQLPLSNETSPLLDIHADAPSQRLHLHTAPSHQVHEDGSSAGGHLSCSC